MKFSKIILSENQIINHMRQGNKKIYIGTFGNNDELMYFRSKD